VVKLIIFFFQYSVLANRLAKGTIGISDLDKAIGKMSIEEKGNKELQQVSGTIG
jgi:hypothetical protein